MCQYLGYILLFFCFPPLFRVIARLGQDSNFSLQGL